MLIRFFLSLRLCWAAARTSPQWDQFAPCFMADSFLARFIYRRFVSHTEARTSFSSVIYHFNTAQYYHFNTADPARGKVGEKYVLNNGLLLNIYQTIQRKKKRVNMSTCQAHVCLRALCSCSTKPCGTHPSFHDFLLFLPPPTAAVYNPIPQWLVSKQSRQRHSCPHVPVHLVGTYADEACGEPEQHREQILTNWIGGWPWKGRGGISLVCKCPQKNPQKNRVDKTYSISGTKKIYKWSRVI